MKKISFAFWLLLLFLFSFPSLIFAQSKKDSIFKGLDIDIALGTSYDDNILKYSDYYLNKFIVGEDSGRFHINSSDGLILNPSLKLSATFIFFGTNKTIVSGNINPQYYINNSIRNSNQLGVDLQQSMGKRISANFSYDYIPNSYLRHYRDNDWVDIFGYSPETYQPFSYSKNVYSLWLQRSFFKKRKTKLRLLFSYDEYFYNEHFTEYDCKNRAMGFKIYQTLFKKMSLDFGYRYITSNAKGYDELDETKYDSDDSDPSYNADEFSSSVKWAFNPILKRSSSIDFDFIYRRDCYTTNHYLENDKLHAGRFDNKYRFKISYEILLLRSFKMSLFYYINKQDSDTKAEANKNLVSLEKDYLQHQGGITFKYSFNDIKFKYSGNSK